MHVRLAGTIGEGASTELKSYTEIYTRLPKIEDIIADPEYGWTVPSEASERYAITTMLSHNINSENIEKMMKAVTRLPIEFQVVTMRDIYKRTPELKQHPIIIDWIAKNSSKLF